MHNLSGGIRDWALVRLIIAGSIGLFTAFLFFEGFTEAGIRLIISWSAKIGLTCFCIAFGASAFHRWQQNSFSFWVFRNRKYWGISFAILHLLHLAALGILQMVFHPVFELAESTSLLAGGLAYLFVVLMLLTSFKLFAAMLSPKTWKLLHTIGGYWIMVIFISSYTKRALNQEYWALIFLGMIGLVLIGRVWKWRIKRN